MKTSLVALYNMFEVGINRWLKRTGQDDSGRGWTAGDPFGYSTIKAVPYTSQHESHSTRWPCLWRTACGGSLKGLSC